MIPILSCFIAPCTPFLRDYTREGDLLKLSLAWQPLHHVRLSLRQVHDQRPAGTDSVAGGYGIVMAANGAWLAFVVSESPLNGRDINVASLGSQQRVQTTSALDGAAHRVNRLRQ